MNLIYPRRVRFKCLRCPICCGDTEKKVRQILLLNAEAERISKEMAKSVDEFADKKEDSEPYTYIVKKTSVGKCVFLKDDECSIYPIRPLICRFYPFQLRTDGNDRYVFTSTDECPGVGCGPYLKEVFFRRLLNDAKNSMTEACSPRSS